MNWTKLFAYGAVDLMRLPGKSARRSRRSSRSRGRAYSAPVYVDYAEVERRAREESERIRAEVKERIDREDREYFGALYPVIVAQRQGKFALADALMRELENSQTPQARAAESERKWQEMLARAEEMDKP